jgi:hypothetical protein
VCVHCLFYVDLLHLVPCLTLYVALSIMHTFYSELHLILGSGGVTPPTIFSVAGPKPG